jgi:hypothetical protein
VYLGYSRPKYTWNNRQEGENNVKVRLDKVVANGQFMQLFDYWQVENIITSSSDHYAILMSTGSHPPCTEKKPFSQNFRYEAMWARAADYSETVEKIWNEGFNGPRNLQSIWSNLNKMAGSLRKWSSKTFGSVQKEIMKLEKRLAKIRSSGTTPTYIDEERSIERKLCELFECEEIMARQRLRVDWLLEGDRNTSFFHASARRNTNRISYIIRDNGTNCENKEEIKGTSRNFYINLFSSEPCAQIDKILEAIPQKVNHNTNDELCKTYTDEEIREALF